MNAQILLEQRYGRAVDWWAFGVLTYEMLLGQSPFRGDDEDEIFDAILEDEPLYPITMPRDAVSILQKVCLLSTWMAHENMSCLHTGTPSSSPVILQDVSAPERATHRRSRLIRFSRTSASTTSSTNESPLPTSLPSCVHLESCHFGSWYSSHLFSTCRAAARTRAISTKSSRKSNRR